MERSVIIVAGGSGKRMGEELPKQFLKIGDQPILMHAITAFLKFDPSLKIILVLPDDQKSYWQKLCEEYSFSIEHTIVSGGAERFDSVRNGLAHVKNEDLVAVHDGVRPFVSQEVIIKCFSVANEKGNAIPCMPLNESIRKVENDNNYAVDRGQYRNIQTPQVFQAKQIKQAYSNNNTGKFTDDASVLESIGEKINLVEGNIENIKITTPFDLKIAEILIKS